MVAYSIMMVIIGFPLFLLECGIGQFSSLGPIALFKVSPLFKGVGFAMMILACMGTSYYSEVVAECLYYFFASFNFDRLPWSFCDPQWSSKNCVDFSASGKL